MVIGKKKQKTDDPKEIVWPAYSDLSDVPHGDSDSDGGDKTGKEEKKLFWPLLYDRSAFDSERDTLWSIRLPSTLAERIKCDFHPLFEKRDLVPIIVDYLMTELSLATLRREISNGLDTVYWLGLSEYHEAPGSIFSRPVEGGSSSSIGVQLLWEKMLRFDDRVRPWWWLQVNLPWDAVRLHEMPLRREARVFGRVHEHYGYDLMAEVRASHAEKGRIMVVVQIEGVTCDSKAMRAQLVSHSENRRWERALANVAESDSDDDDGNSKKPEDNSDSLVFVPKPARSQKLGDPSSTIGFYFRATLTLELNPNKHRGSP